MTMSVQDFEFYKDMLKTRAGIVLSPDKTYLLVSRLTPVAKEWGYSSLNAMTIALRGIPEPALVTAVIEAMTTNETSFFRDPTTFETLKDVALPYLLKNRLLRKSIRIWCAASSSGQEPYTIAMVLKEMGQQLNGWQVEIIATDISNEILDVARKGVFTSFEVQRGLPAPLLVKYFTQQDNGNWQVNDALRQMIRFSYFNLLDPMDHWGGFDIVFCRNVLIYFDAQTKCDILERITALLPADGMLFMGGAETPLGVTEAFKPLSPYRGFYILNNGKCCVEDFQTYNSAAPESMNIIGKHKGDANGN